MGGVSDIQATYFSGFPAFKVAGSTTWSSGRLGFRKGLWSVRAQIALALGKVSDWEGYEELRTERVLLMDCFWFEVMLRL